MLSIFTIPKPFEKHTEIIQRNAIQSWIRMEPKCEVFLCGNEKGTKEVALEYHTKFIPDIARNRYGTPLLSSSFEKVRAAATNSLMCYVNADIIFLDDLLPAVQRIRRRRFLLLGNRWDVDIRGLIDFGDQAWQSKTRSIAISQGSLHPPTGCDYFIFETDGDLTHIPGFAVGRPGWDNWFIYNARNRGYAVIDGTRVITAIHQNHDYSHLRKEYCTHKGQHAWKDPAGPEVEESYTLMGGPKNFFKILDATHILSSEKLKRASDYQHIRRRLETLPVLHPEYRGVAAVIDRCVIRVFRRSKRIEKTQIE